MKFVFASIIISAIPYILWDVWATYNKHWSFNAKYHSNIFIYNLPLEEVLFFVVIPFCIIFVWSLLRKYNSWKDLYKKMLTF